jgi:hypothetical protein
LAAAVVAALARWRIRSGAAAAVAWRHSVAEVGILVGMAPWLWIILTPRDAPREVHLLPLRDLAAQLAGDPGVAVAPIGGNLLVLAAFGALAPLRLQALARLPVIIGLAAAFRWQWRHCSTRWRWAGCPRSTTCCSTPPAPV